MLGYLITLGALNLIALVLTIIQIIMYFIEFKLRSKK